MSPEDLEPMVLHRLTYGRRPLRFDRGALEGVGDLVAHFLGPAALAAGCVVGVFDDFAFIDALVRRGGQAA